MSTFITITFLTLGIININIQSNLSSHKSFHRISINDSIVFSTDKNGYGDCAINLKNFEIRASDSIRIYSIGCVIQKVYIKMCVEIGPEFSRTYESSSVSLFELKELMNQHNLNELTLTWTEENNKDRLRIRDCYSKIIFKK